MRYDMTCIMFGEGPAISRFLACSTPVALLGNNKGRWLKDSRLSHHEYFL